jgi:hypothetical protein
VREGGDWFARSGLWRFGVPMWCVLCDSCPCGRVVRFEDEDGVGEGCGWLWMKNQRWINLILLQICE